MSTLLETNTQLLETLLDLANAMPSADDLETKADYKGKYLGGGSSAQYVKICTVRLPISNADLFLEFDLAGRTYDRYQKVKFIARRGAATTSMICALFVSGGKGNAYNVRAYRYLTETLTDEYIEVWCSLPAWDGLNILKKSFASNYTAIDQNFTWNYEIASAFPTTSDSIAVTYGSLEDWTGKVDPSVVTMKGYTKPSSTDAITSADSLNSAIGKLEKALDGLNSTGDGTSSEIITTAGTGAAYTATVPSITELTAGVNFIMIPHTNSTSTTPTLDVNGLGAKGIRQPSSFNTSAVYAGSTTTWLVANKPVRVMYDGTQWKIDIARPVATNLYGVVPVANGGTGNSSVDTTPTSGSTKMVTSGGVYDAINAIEISSNPVTIETQSTGNSYISATSMSTITIPTGKTIDDVFMLTFTDAYGISYTAVKTGDSISFTGMGVATGTTTPKIYWGTISLSTYVGQYTYFRLGSCYSAAFGATTASEITSLAVSSVTIYVK